MIGLIAGICIGRRKRGYTSPRTDPQQEGGVPIGQVPHQRLEETGGEGEGNAGNDRKAHGRTSGPARVGGHGVTLVHVAHSLHLVIRCVSVINA